jgi:hypothetical protein
MKLFRKKHSILTVILFSWCIQTTYAGPPFLTDDPQPVGFKHWEFYISSVNTMQSNNWSGTSPHFEVNYGLIPNLQVHLLLPLNYSYTPHLATKFGYANSEFGVKYCFISETADRPQIGIFPIVQIPTFKNQEFGNGKAQVFLPVWTQKSWGKLTSYGGVGYSINPGIGNKNWMFTGWEIQYDFSPLLTLGGEIYYHSPDTIDSKSITACNIGGSVNFTEKFHLIFSVGHSLANENFFSSYVGLLWTI